jgi:hypothetical protein
LICTRRHAVVLYRLRVDKCFYGTTILHTLKKHIKNQEAFSRANKRYLVSRLKRVKAIQRQQKHYMSQLK